MRHGPAEGRAKSGRDADRALTREGQAVVEKAAGALAAARGSGQVRVLSSPFRRAQETAAVVARVLAAPAPDLHDDLSGDADTLPLSLCRELYAAGRDALLVGHQPFMEALVRELLHPATVSLPGGFRPATIVVLASATGGRFRLEAVIDPHAG